MAWPLIAGQILTWAGRGHSAKNSLRGMGINTPSHMDPEYKQFHTNALKGAVIGPDPIMMLKGLDFKDQTKDKPSGTAAPPQQQQQIPREPPKEWQPLLDHGQRNVQGGMMAQTDQGNFSIMGSPVKHPDLNEGQPTLIPHVWDGQALDDNGAIQRAIASGVKWPYYETDQEAHMFSQPFMV